MSKNYDYLTGDLLKARFPYMFNTKDNFAYAFHRGWMPILSGLCVEIEQLLGGRREAFHWKQIKEKFGTGRFYYSLGTARDLRVDLMSPVGRVSFNAEVKADDAFNDIKQAVSKLVSDGEEETTRSCMICGAAAKPRSYGRYILNLCTDHHPDKIRQPGDVGNEAVWRLADAANAPGTPNGGEGGAS